MDKAKLIEAGLALGAKAVDWAKTENGQAFLCGTYTDGSTRSFRDAWNDEIMSPASRKKRIKDIEKRKKELEKALFDEPKKKKHKKKKKGKKKKNKKKSKSRKQLYFDF